jgi:hypothetical protein
MAYQTKIHSVSFRRGLFRPDAVAVTVRRTDSASGFCDVTDAVRLKTEAREGGVMPPHMDFLEINAITGEAVAHRRVLWLFRRRVEVKRQVVFSTLETLFERFKLETNRQRRALHDLGQQFGMRGEA